MYLPEQKHWFWSLQQLDDKTEAALDQLRAMVQQASGTVRLRLMSRLQDVAPKPRLEDAEAFSFWAASVANLSPSEKLKVLLLDNTEERINLLLERVQDRCRFM